MTGPDNVEVTPCERALHIALTYVGTREHGSNRGPEVEKFQKAIDGKAQGEAWCCAFVEYCVIEAASRFQLHQNLFKTEHCLTAWQKSPAGSKWIYLPATAQFQNVGLTSVKRFEPQSGWIVIWQHGQSTNGHTGFVVKREGSSIITVEGNTGPDDKTVQREGDGVYQKRRALSGSGDMHIVGFIEPLVRV